MNQPEFWMTVKEDGVYPDRVESGSTTDFASLSFDILTEQRTTSYWCRKLTNVRYTDSPGLHELTYELTDKYERVYVLDVADQPPEGTVLVCQRINSKLLAFGSDTRHDGGTA